MNVRKFLGGLATAAVVALGAAGLAACGHDPIQIQQPQPPCCTAPVPTTGIEVGTNPADQGWHQAWAGEAGQIAAAAARSGARVIIDRFGNGPASSEVTFNAPVAASASAQNFLIQEGQRDQAEKRMVAGFRAAMSPASSGQVDLLSGLQQMEQHLREANATSADLVVFGDAVQTTGPINLADPVQLADPKMSLETLRSAGLLQPGSCAGINAYMVNPVPAGWNEQQDTMLREFWREYFQACGGRLVLWDSALVAFPASGQVPETSWARGGQLPIQLPAALLFLPNQPVFRPGAGTTLAELCRAMTGQYPHSTATIAGYTARVGAGDGTALSLARARAVAAYLTGGSCDINPSRLLWVKGFGDHHQIPGGLAANRRVAVTIQTR
jgi:OmpA family